MNQRGHDVQAGSGKPLRARIAVLASRVPYLVAMAVFLAAFTWLNVVSTNISWGAGALRIVALKWIPGVCECRRCIAPGKHVRHYTHIGLTKEAHHFCDRHIANAPAQIGQFGPGVALFSGSVLSLVAVFFFLYALVAALVQFFRWDEKNPSIPLFRLMLASALLYVVPTVYSYLIGVG